MAELKIRQVVRMPEFVGQPLRKALFMVENAGLQLDVVLYRESYEDKNTVLEQKPNRGQMVYVGDTVTLHVARTGYMELLPAMYRRSDATGRNFVRDLCFILEHLFGALNEKLDTVYKYFDPYECPEDFLHWLAGWTAMTVDLDWPTDKKRTLIRRAVELYGIRGTRKGLALFLELFTGHEPKLIENEWPFKGFRIEVEGLIGIDSVILPPVPRSRCFIVEMPIKFTDVSPEMVIRIHNIIQMEKPANTHYYLRFAADAEQGELREFFSIGMRSGIGVDASRYEEDEDMAKAALGKDKDKDNR